MKTKTRYELYWRCAGERALYSTSNRLNNGRFQKDINHLKKYEGWFEVVEITQKVICNHKTAKW